MINTLWIYILSNWLKHYLIEHFPSNKYILRNPDHYNAYNQANHNMDRKGCDVKCIYLEIVQNTNYIKDRCL